MGLAENKQVVLDFYAAGARGDMVSCFALLADDISWINIGSTKFSGKYAGKQALMENLLGPLLDQLKAGISSKIGQLVAEGDLLMSLGQDRAAGADSEHFNLPADVAILRDGSFCISDGYANTRVVKFSPEGLFQFQWGEAGSDEGQFTLPHGIAVDNESRVYVVDAWGKRVQKFTAR